MIFPLLYCSKRTDSSFRTQEQKKHHVSITPVHKLDDVDLIFDFVIDSMLLIFLGITKKKQNTFYMPPSPNKVKKMICCLYLKSYLSYLVEFQWNFGAWPDHWTKYYHGKQQSSECLFCTSEFWPYEEFRMINFLTNLPFFIPDSEF